MRMAPTTSPSPSTSTSPNIADPAGPTVQSPLSVIGSKSRARVKVSTSTCRCSTCSTVAGSARATAVQSMGRTNGCTRSANRAAGSRMILPTLTWRAPPSPKRASAHTQTGAARLRTSRALVLPSHLQVHLTSYINQFTLVANHFISQPHQPFHFPATPTISFLSHTNHYISRLSPTSMGC